ncbi:restriction endonuclease [Burkholderia stabilis]|uniref:restriction endonuclease n=1 Tax=Burkholderia stabilis TaxID=95485 RepID=UPI001F4B7583|nr:restriction endonuclease [Burkholderia stabilis]
MNHKMLVDVARYRNPDNDPRGPYILKHVTGPFDRPFLRYEWNGRMPPPGRSWRFSKQRAEELEQEGRIVFSSSGQPMLKRFLHETSGNLLNLLRTLPDTQAMNEADFTKEVVPRFVKILDYEEVETFYNYEKNKYRADVVLSNSIESKPWLVIEIKMQKFVNIDGWIYQLQNYLGAFESQVGVLVSPEVVILMCGEEVRRFDLKQLTSEQAEEILLTLDRDAQPSPSSNRRSMHVELVRLIEAVESAATNNEKGRSLEALARSLFGSVSALRCKYSNLQTRSSEIDLVIEYDQSKGRLALFDEIGRYCLVECKNWSKPVGVGPVRDFMGKLDKCKIKLGVIFSKNGVTGVDSGADALREIQSRFDRDGVFLLVFSLEDLRGIADGEMFAAALERKADGLRFDV